METAVLWHTTIYVYYTFLVAWSSVRFVLTVFLREAALCNLYMMPMLQVNITIKGRYEYNAPVNHGATLFWKSF